MLANTDYVKNIPKIYKELQKLNTKQLLSPTSKWAHELNSSQKKTHHPGMAACPVTPELKGGGGRNKS